MAYANHVSKTQIIDLLGKLAVDDGYRSRFEHNPEMALAELNFAPGGFAGFVSDKAHPGTLGDKAIFAAARKRMVNEVASDCLCMVIPNFRLDFGNKNLPVSVATR